MIRVLRCLMREVKISESYGEIVLCTDDVDCLAELLGTRADLGKPMYLTNSNERLWVLEAAYRLAQDENNEVLKAHIMAAILGDPRGEE